MARVDVILPLGPGDAELAKGAVASIERQTFGDVNLIVVNDSEGRGAAWARNKGLESAAGEFVAFCDADDYMADDALERLVGAIGNTQMAAGGFRKFGAFESFVSHVYGSFPRSAIAAYAMRNLRNPRSHQMLSGCWAKLYRRDRVQPFPMLTTAEDMAFNFEYLRGVNAVRFLPGVVYHNQKRAGSLTSTFDPANPRGLFGVLEALGSVRRFLAEFYTAEELEPALDNSKMYHSMLYFMRICEQEGGAMRENFTRLFP